MNRDDVRNILHSPDLKPSRICLHDGREYRVYGVANYLLMADWMSVGVNYDHNYIAESTERLKYSDIESIQPIEEASAA
jgi:hypothetical protein